MKTIEIMTQGGAVISVKKPDDTQVIIKDFDTDGVDIAVLKKDTDGDEYQEFIFPAEQNSVTVTLPPQVEQTELTIRSYYRHCGEEWDVDWDCACDDECPKCRKTIQPYKHEDIRDFIGWQPRADEFPVAGLQSFEVYENLEHGKGCHPEIKKWIPIYENDIEAVTIIPYDGENKE